MHPDHLRFVERLSPQAAAKSRLLGQLGVGRGSPFIIEDPFGKSPEVFRVCFDNIDTCLSELVSTVQQIRSEGQPNDR